MLNESHFFQKKPLVSVRHSLGGLRDIAVVKVIRRKGSGAIEGGDNWTSCLHLKKQC